MNSAMLSSFMISFFLTSTLLYSVSTYHILTIPLPWKSHYKLHELVCTKLIERGHRVTVIVPNTETYISTISLDKIVYDAGQLPSDPIRTMINQRIANGEDLSVMLLLQLFDIQATLIHRMLEDRRVQRIAKEADFVITDHTYAAVNAALELFNLPFFILPGLATVNGCFADLYGVPEFPSYIPTVGVYSIIKQFPPTDEMSLSERGINFAFQIIYKAVLILFEYRYRVAFSDLPLTSSLRDTIKRTSLVLLPFDFAVDYPIPLPPNVKLIGPLTVAEGHPLSSTFKHILSSAKSGVVIVNYGTDVALYKPWVERMMKVLLNLDEKVVWRYSRKAFIDLFQDNVKVSRSLYQSNTRRNIVNSTTSGKAYMYERCMKDNLLPTLMKDNGDHLVLEDRLYIFDWIPQNDLLSHPNVSVFMSHCGISSMFEAIYHQVPQICSPQFGDQWENAGRMRSRKLGKALTFDQVNSNVIRRHIKELKSNTEIKASLALASKRLKSRKRSSVEEAADILETYMEYGDSSFLRPREADMSYLQLYCLDIALMIIFVGIMLLMCFKRTFGMSRDKK